MSDDDRARHNTNVQKTMSKRLLPGALFLAGFAVYVNFRGEHTMTAVDWTVCVIAGLFLLGAIFQFVWERSKDVS